jgi:hypothetical protein
MRRVLLAIFVAGSVAATATLSGCPAAHDGYPGGTCKTDKDCFKGEKCMNASICVPVQAAVDMAVVVPPSNDMAQAVDDMAMLADMATGDDL